MDAGARILAKRYARAYMDLDGKVYGAGTDAPVREKLEGLRKIFDATRPHQKVLTHPAVNAGVKLDVLTQILGRGEGGPAAALAALMVKQGRFNLFEQAMQESLRLYYDFCGVVRADVRSRYPLSEGELKRVEKLLAGPAGGKVSLRQIVSDEVVGGFEIKVGDTLIDATVKGRLEALKAGLLGS
jgi:F-type H+-transporting ATPase subunit delta